MKKLRSHNVRPQDCEDHRDKCECCQYWINKNEEVKALDEDPDIKSNASSRSFTSRSFIPYDEQHRLYYEVCPTFNLDDEDDIWL